MAEVLKTALGVVLGLGLIAGVFWLAFRRMPEAREPPAVSFDPIQWGSSSDPGPSDGPSG